MRSTPGTAWDTEHNTRNRRGSDRVKVTDEKQLLQAENGDVFTTIRACNKCNKTLPEIRSDHLSVLLFCVPSGLLIRPE